jgi:hypothetical protein
MECETCSYLQGLLYVEAPKLEAFTQDLSVGLLVQSSAACCVLMLPAGTLLECVYTNLSFYTVSSSKATFHEVTPLNS